ncbi:PREDICTED: solute carrier family 22 member 18 [Cyprinodon variegatus]|uniref:Organic cation transporter-like protein 2 n=1 Tax=Cyprinodon variegatus TaxID=28743 RepID=A0A3Q2DRY5_CYPVA|nr:PREDICTED: solute carrier family 22 member 18 [Cyprinodon variegatus]
MKREGGTSAAPASSTTKTKEESHRMRVIFVVYIIAVLDVTWMFLSFSVTPYLAKKLGFDTLWFGYLQTTVGVIQLIGGPMFGRFGDLFGARAALSLACAATTVFFGLLAAANHPFMLFVHKLPTVFMHVIPACQMVVTDLSEPDKRADALSKLGLCFGIGMVVGSTLGGHLSTHYGETFAACVGAAGSAFSLILVLCFIPKSTKSEASRSSSKSENKNQKVFNVGEIIRLMKFPGVMRIFLIKIITGLPSGIFQVMFSVIVMDFFKLEAQQNGYLMAYFGIVQMVVQGGVIGRLTSRFPEKSLLLLSIGITGSVGLAQAYMQTVLHLCITVTPWVFSLSLFSVITDTMLTKSVPPSDTGTMLGLCASVQSLIRTIGPTIGGFLYMNYGLPSIGLLEFFVNLVVFVYLLYRQLKKAEKHKE